MPYNNNTNKIFYDDSADLATFTYGDRYNRLTAYQPTGVSATTYTYNMVGQRVQRDTPTVNEKYVYDGTNVIADYDGDTSDAYLRGYLTTGLDNNEILFTDNGGSPDDVHYYFKDGLGSIRQIIDDAATPAVEAYLDYYAFGSDYTPQTSNISANRYKWKNQQFYSESSNYFLNHNQIYDPSNAIFLINEIAISNSILLNKINLMLPTFQYCKQKNCFFDYIENEFNNSKEFTFSIKTKNSIDLSRPIENYAMDSVSQSIINCFKLPGFGPVGCLKTLMRVCGQASKRIAAKIKEFMSQTARNFISNRMKGKLNKEFPKEFYDKTLDEIKKLARKKGNKAAKKAWELLNKKTKEYMKAIPKN